MLPIETLVSNVRSLTQPVVAPQPIQQQPVQQQAQGTAQASPSTDAAGEFVKALFGRFNQQAIQPQATASQGVGQSPNLPQYSVTPTSLRPAQLDAQGSSDDILKALLTRLLGGI